MARPKKKEATLDNEVASTESAQSKSSLSIPETTGAVNDSDIPTDAIQISRDEYIKMSRAGSPVVVVASTPKKYYLLSKSKK